MRPDRRQLVTYVLAAITAGVLFGLIEDSIAAGVCFGLFWGVGFALLFQRFGVPYIEAEVARKKDERQRRED